MVSACNFYLRGLCSFAIVPLVRFDWLVGYDRMTGWGNDG
jgi:hypothetical protein